MPEKSKRRRNNKNKRKNKNKPDCNKNENSEVKETGSVESGSVLSLESEENIEPSDLQLCTGGNKVEPPPVNSLCVIQSNLINQGNDDNSHQDLNNNSEETVVCETVSISNEHLNAHNSETYTVESPDQSLKAKPKLNCKSKSKSLDNDDDTKIEEITDDSYNQLDDDNTLAVIDSNILVTDVDSDVEWEKIEEGSSLDAKELATGTLSVTTMPLNVAQCELTKTLTPDEEKSLRHYLQTLNLSTSPNVNAIEIKTEIEQIINREIRHRLRKKGLAEDVIPTRLGPPRILDVIDEEGSSESSLTSRRQSYLSDKKSDNEELEDDVFEDKKGDIQNHSSKSTVSLRRNHNTIGRLVPQECTLVGAKLKEPEFAEARGAWTMKTVEEMKGAEVVYLTDSSSSTSSSVHELCEDTDNGEETDVSIRMITPTIEVTDTDHLLTNTFIQDSNSNKDVTEVNDCNNIPNSDIQTNSIKPHPDPIDNNYELNSHEIVVASIDNIQTNLFVKDIDEKNNSKKILQEVKLKDTIENDKISSKEKSNDDYKLEIKVLKCELNDAINNLIQEVCSDTENNEEKDNFTRQDSSSSIGSSQCTAKYNPTYSSLTDVSNMHDEKSDAPKIADNIQENSITSHVKDVFKCVTGVSTQKRDSASNFTSQPSALRDICVQRIATLPYGEKILEELASVSERLQSINTIGITTQNQRKDYPKNMPYYPLPDVSSIEKVTLPLHQKEMPPPPVQPRKSSLKKSQDDHHWSGVPTKVEPVYICLSPSQKMLMEKTNTVITKDDASQLVDIHRKYIDRRGYNEPSNNSKISQNDYMDPPIVPFKSQTGSRLLALIRDPAVTSNISSSVSSLNNYSSENLKKDSSRSEFISKAKDKFRDFSGNFKPIPPPRPKKYSSSYYESDESSDFTDNSLRSIKSERKVFHFSTGNLSKDIEDDVSSIQNMHRYYTNVRDHISDVNRPRRPSLPKDLCDQQMEYIRQKEKEVEAEIKRLESEKLNISSTEKRGPRAPLIKENETVSYNMTSVDNLFSFSRKQDVSFDKHSSEKLCKGKLSSQFSSSQEELLREKMYSEYVTQMAEREERKQHKIIKITNPSTNNNKSVSKSMTALDILDSKVNNRIEKEFICKARERWNKLGITDPETEDERDKDVYREPKVVEHKIKVIEAGQERDVKRLPTHLQEFVSFTAKQKEQGTGSSGESGSTSASPHVVILCAVMILVIAIGKYFMRLLRNK